MSGYFRPRNIAILGGIGAALFLFPRTAAKANVGNVFETQGVKNIGDRYSAGGGSNTHMTGTATPRGSSDQTLSNQTNPKGIDTPNFQNSQADQKVGEPNVVGKAFNNAHYGANNEKGK